MIGLNQDGDDASMIWILLTINSHSLKLRFSSTNSSGLQSATAADSATEPGRTTACLRISLELLATKRIPKRTEVTPIHFKFTVFPFLIDIRLLLLP